MIFLPFEPTARILKMETTLHPNGRVKLITYKVNGRIHRDDGPAFQEWNGTGVLNYESWRQNGRLHRDNGPAHRRWNNAGVLIVEIWWKNDRWHRYNGPAYQQWNNAGELIVEEWCQNGRDLPPEEIEKILRPDDIMSALREGLPQPIFEEIEGVFRAV